jgi:hypothetical protein
MSAGRWCPASVGLFQFRTPISRKLEDSEKHKRRIFSYYGQTIFWDFVGLNFSLVKFLWANPLLAIKMMLAHII